MHQTYDEKSKVDDKRRRLDPVKDREEIKRLDEQSDVLARRGHMLAEEVVATTREYRDVLEKARQLRSR